MQSVQMFVQLLWLLRVGRYRTLSSLIITMCVSDAPLPCLSAAFSCGASTLT